MNIKEIFPMDKDMEKASKKQKQKRIKVKYFKIIKFR